jgi:membrane-associated phospholipid phosphatase
VEHLAFLAMAFAFYLVAWRGLPDRWSPVLALAGLVVFQLALVALRRRFGRRPGVQVLQLLGIVAFVGAGFGSLSYTIPVVNPHRFDAALAGLDQLLLGGSPTHWTQAWTQPVLTDVFYVLYLVYFPMPVILVWWLLATGRREQMERSVFIYLVCYYLGAALYFAVPAQGPRFFLRYDVPLDGWLLAAPIRNLINALEPNKLDAFPSMHTAIVVVTLIVARWYHKPMFRVYAALSVGIGVSLVYCRYHYVVDIAGGAAIAIASGVVGPMLYDRWRPRFAAHFQPPTEAS